MTFDIPGNWTVNQRGEKTILVTTTGHEENKFTLVLSCKADDIKLKSVVIFKRKTVP